MKVTIFALFLVSSVFGQQSCSNQYTCKNNGVDREFTYCNKDGVVQELSCVDGTVCKQNKDQVFCGWPRGAYAQHFLDELSLLNLQVSELNVFPTPTESPELAIQVSSLLKFIEGQISDVKSRIEEDIGGPVGTSAIASEISVLDVITSELPLDIATIADLTEITATSDVTDPSNLSSTDGNNLPELTGDLNMITRAASFLVKKQKPSMETMDYDKQVQMQRDLLNEIRFVSDAAKLASDVSIELNKPKGKHDAKNIRELAIDIGHLAEIAEDILEPTSN
ncbi:hypothetical protein BB561_003824 [Smittium simulii]|uniref:Uncharacterized protein n=1 Tax=Smittium simulii TaxID=133385 RepID=A0A2T9YJE8_9FUNG|nr:hypothetical protein BB561_003824 [Smittium simulii]